LSLIKTIKSTWKVVDEILDKKDSSSSEVEYLMNKFHVKMYSKSDMCTEFNSFFANEGSSISDSIKSNGYISQNWDLLNQGCHINESIFLSPINQAGN